MKKDIITFSLLVLMASLFINCKSAYQSSVDPEEDKVLIQEEEQTPPSEKSSLEESKIEPTPFEEVKSHYTRYVAIDNKNIDYDEFSNQLRIARYQIPLNEVNIFYSFVENNNFRHYVNFDCKIGKCLNDGNLIAIGALIPFKSKESCFKFIDLLSKLLKEN